MNGGHPIEVNLNITIRLSQRLETQIERVIALLTTATRQYHDEENNNDDEDEIGTTG